MYQIKCDDCILYDPRDDEYVLLNPKCKLQVNTVGEGSFTILSNHPHYGQLKKLKSLFEIKQDDDVIFRGRMVNDCRDIYNQMNVDLEGVLGFTNDTLVPPFNFPDDFADAASAENMVEYFLQWILDQHNQHAEPWQQLKLGKVTVSDPNNYITRSSEKYDSTWNTLKSKLFESALGGFLICRYEADGNYVDYLSAFELTNTQRVNFGENLLDITNEFDTSETYSAILPMGAEIETEVEGTEETVKTTLTLESLPDGDLTDDLVKQGLYIYSKSAKSAHGWICAPVEESTWDDVTEVENLKNKAVEFLSGTALKLSNTITIKAVDLHFTDDEIQSFRIYRNILVNSPLHGVSDASYQLTELDIDIVNPQNTTITIGATVRTLADVNAHNQNQIENVKKDIKENRTEVVEVKNQMVIRETEIINTANQIFMSALESYVETSNYEEFKSTLKSELEVWAGGISGRVSQTESAIEDVNGDLQEKFNTITKYFTFDIDGLTIGQVDNPNKVVIDNDQISILVNNIPVQEFKADGTALIPILKITQMLNLLGLLIEEDDTHINCDYIGGVS